MSFSDQFSKSILRQYFNKHLSKASVTKQKERQKKWSSQYIFQYVSNWKEEAWKYQGFNGIRTCDIRDIGAMLYQLSYEATHWERGQFIEFISPLRSEMMRSIHEMIHIWTAVVDESEEWSSQIIFQFKQLERRSLKKSGLQRDSNPWPPRHRSNALSTELWSHTLGARSIYWVHISLEEWK